MHKQLKPKSRETTNLLAKKSKKMNRQEWNNEDNETHISWQKSQLN